MIGESLNNINILGGKVVSVTTDGFCTDVDDLESRMLKLDSDSIYFLSRARKCRLVLTDVKGSKADPSAYELKCCVKGIVQWCTRGQVSINEGAGVNGMAMTNQVEGYGEIAATTGFSRRGMSHKELSGLLYATFVSKKELSFVQKSLVGANENYKRGVECTPSLSVRLYKMKFDGRREVVIPESIKKVFVETGKMPVDMLYDTKPFVRANNSSLHRGMMDTYKQSKYTSFTPRLLPSTKEYESFNERSVFNDIFAGRETKLVEQDIRSPDFGKSEVVKLDFVEAVDKLAKLACIKNLVEKYKRLELELWGLESEFKSLKWSDINRLYTTVNAGRVVETDSGFVVKESLKTVVGLDGKIVKKLELEKSRLYKLISGMKLLSSYDYIGVSGGLAGVRINRFMKGVCRFYLCPDLVKNVWLYSVV